MMRSRPTLWAPGMGSERQWLFLCGVVTTSSFHSTTTDDPPTLPDLRNRYGRSDVLSAPRRAQRGGKIRSESRGGPLYGFRPPRAACGPGRRPRGGGAWAVDAGGRGGGWAQVVRGPEREIGEGSRFARKRALRARGCLREETDAGAADQRAWCGSHRAIGLGLV